MLGFENVEKGKRLKYFKDYYMIPSIIFLIVIIMVVSIIKATVFREKEDLNILITAASTDLSFEHIEKIENSIKDNYNVDYNKNGTEKLVINQAILSSTVGTSDFKEVEQDMAAGMKLAAVLETSLCTIQLVDQDMYEYLLSEQMIETYENLKEFGLKGEGYVKVPLSDTKLDPKNADNIYLTVRPKSTSRIDPEIYAKHIELVKQIVG